MKYRMKSFQCWTQAHTPTHPHIHKHKAYRNRQQNTKQEQYINGKPSLLSSIRCDGILNYKHLRTIWIYLWRKLTFYTQFQLIRNCFTFTIDCTTRIISGWMLRNSLQYQTLIRPDHTSGCIMCENGTLDDVHGDKNKITMKLVSRAI